MQSVFNGGNLHEMSNPIFWKKKKKKNWTNLSSAEIVLCVVKVMVSGHEKMQSTDQTNFRLTKKQKILVLKIFFQLWKFNMKT